MNFNHTTAMLLLSIVLYSETGFDLDAEKSKLSNSVFNHYDLDKNNTLSYDEFSTFSLEMKKKEQEKRVEKTIHTCDKNEDNKIELSEVPTQKEMMKAYRKRGKEIMKLCRLAPMQFNQIDTNQDKIITSKELLHHYSKSYFSVWTTRPHVEKLDELKIFKERLKNCDKDEDKRITLIEATSIGCFMSSNVFLQYSSDANGSFKIESVTKTPKSDIEGEIKHQFLNCDNNQDKKINLVEATSKWCHIFYDEFIRLDKDKNENLSQNEIRKRFEKPKDGEMPKIPFKILKDMPPEVKISMAFMRCDSDKNNKLNRKEAKECELSMEIFNSFDSDKNGAIEENDLTLMERNREFEMVDMNRDKRIDKKEFLERMGNRCRVF